MSDKKFQNKYRIQSARATWHDYGGGAYFVTVRTKNGEHYFGEIVVEMGHGHDVKTGRAPSLQIPVMQLFPMGQCLYDNLKNVTDHYPYIEIPLFVVMPNHWHAIVFVDGNKTPYVRGHDVEMGRGHDVETGRGHDVETGRAPSLQTQTTTKKMKKIDSCKGWLSVAIGGIKSAVTKFAHENGIDFAWQTRFHDRIIRDQIGMNRIVHYIENNPALWDNDCSNEKNNKNDDKM